MKTVPCKGCGKPIMFARTSDGKTIPLDPRPPVYLVTENADGATCDRIGPGQSLFGHPMATMVSHFATCPKASQFSGSKRGGKEGVGQQPDHPE